LLMRPGEPAVNKKLAREIEKGFAKGIADAKRGLSRLRSPVPIGTRVIAIHDFGPIRTGAPGIITGATKVPFLFWKRFYYLCTFRDNMKVAARPKDIDDDDHGYTLDDLQNPDVLSAMTTAARRRRQGV
jgi:hypothetical protein